MEGKESHNMDPQPEPVPPGSPAGGSTPDYSPYGSSAYDESDIEPGATEIARGIKRMVRPKSRGA